MEELGRKNTELEVQLSIMKEERDKETKMRQNLVDEVNQEREMRQHLVQKMEDEKKKIKSLEERAKEFDLVRKNIDFQHRTEMEEERTKQQALEDKMQSSFMQLQKEMPLLVEHIKKVEQGILNIEI